MSLELRAILFEERCLIQLDYLLGQRLLEGLRRVESRGPAPEQSTIMDYAGRCGDVRMTIPLMAGRERIASHLVTGMEALKPPPRLQQFHQHMVATLRDWSVGDPSWSIGSALRQATSQAVNLPPDIYSTLVTSACISGN